MKLLDRAIELLHQLATLVLLPLLTGVITLDVIMRYIFNAPFDWALELNEALLLMMFFGTLPFVTRRNGHIRMELFYSRFRGAMLRLSHVLWSVAGMFTSLALAYKVLNEIPYLIRVNAYTDILGIPLHWLYGFVGFCSIAMGLLFLFILFAGGTVAEHRPDLEQASREGL